MSQDISRILESWDFDPEANVRKIWGDEGIEKIQVRIDQGAFQGILQINLDGRPDGRKPHGLEFALDFYRGELERHRHAHSGAEGGYALSREACKELFDESARIYERYAFLFQLKDYKRVVRDTERNMLLFRFVNHHAENLEDRINLEKWWPYVLRIHGTARAIMAADEQDYDRALEIIEEVREQINGLNPVEAEEFFAERERSLQVLEELEGDLGKKKPLSREEVLQRQLQEAIDNEAFERAAQLRDELKKLKGAGG